MIFKFFIIFALMLIFESVIKKYFLATSIIVMIITFLTMLTFSEFEGQWAYAWFMALIFIGIIAKVTKKRKFKKLNVARYQYGILMFLIILPHVLFSLIDELKNIITLNIEFDILTAIIGTFIIYILVITSFKKIQRALGKNWKIIHMLTHAAFMLITIHAYLFTDDLIYIIIFILYIGLKISTYLYVEVGK